METQLARAAAFFGAHLSLSMVVQVESYAVFLDGPILPFLAVLPFLQLEHMAIAALPAAAALARRRWVPHGLLIVLNLWVVLDQVVFGVFFDHANFSQDESRLSDLPSMTSSLISSLWAEAGALTLFNLVGVAVLTVGIAYRDTRDWPRWSLGRPAVVATSIGLAGSVLASARIENHNLEHHPVLALVGSAIAEPVPPSDIELSESEIRRPIFDEGSIDRQEDLALTEALARLGRLGPRPNVLLIMMESVGSKQLFPGGRPSREVTPVLADQLKHGIAFTSVYTTFPGTIRSLVGLHAGGRIITWGDVHFELSKPYEGVTLVSTFRDRGYESALYSAGDMHFENLDGYMRSLGFGQIVDAGQQTPEWRERHRIHSWGVAEDAMRGNAVRWMRARHEADEPFFLEFITVSTHHPYGVPRSVPRPFAGDDLETRYRNSLHYSDGFVGRLLEEMAFQGILERTLVAIVGDHGQAFGRLHEKNFTHKNFLYEENVRGFLILLAPGAELEPVISDRVASLGDVLPTLQRATGEVPSGTWGQSLWPDDYSPSTVYFHKNAHPELLGLRDGRWKFISRRSGKRLYELYDLVEDPDEQRNLASRFAHRMPRYDALAAQWYAASNQSFVQRLRGYQIPGGRTLTPGEVRSPGPKRLEVGVRGNTWVDNVPPVIRSDDKIIAWTLWVPYAEDHLVRYVWTTPSGTERTHPMSIAKEYAQVRVPYSGPFPMEPGRWKVAIWEEEKELIAHEFEVAEQPQ